MVNLKRILFSISLALIQFHSTAQGDINSSPYRSIDSLASLLKTEQDDTNKVNTLNKIAQLFNNVSNYDTSLYFANSAEILAKKIIFKRGSIGAFIITGFNYTSQGEYKKALIYLTKGLNESREIGDKYLMAAATGNMGTIYYYQGNFLKAYDCFCKSLALGQEIKNKKYIASAFNNIANIYSDQGNYTKALEYYYKALSTSEGTDYKINTETYYDNIGNIYFTQKNFAKALEYSTKALNLAKAIDDKDGIAINYEYLGSNYSAQKNYRKSLEYYFKGLTILQEVGDKPNYANALSNIGNAYLQLSDYSNALTYFSKGVTLSREVENISLLGSLYGGIGTIYTNQKKYLQAKQFLDSGLYLSEKIKNKENLMNIYASFSVLDSATGNYKIAWADYKKYTAYRDSLTNSESVEKTTQMEIGYELQRMNDSIKTAQEKADIIKVAADTRKSIIVYSSIVIVLLTILLIIVLISRRLIKHKKDKIILEKEKQLMEDELKNAQTLLDEYIKNMAQKNKLLEEFKVDLEDIKILKSKELEENRIEHIEHLHKTTILTDEDWDKFKTLFEQVHKGFIIRLKEKLPDLTPSEIRLVCLTKLRLETKQMAAILAVSLTTIKQTRYRLNKKLHLLEEDSIDSIISTI